MSWYRAASTFCGTCDQILLPVGILLSEICGLVSVGRSLWREDGSAICNVITQWSESLRTRNHTLLSHLRLPQPGFLFYIPQEQGGPVIPPGTRFPLRRLLQHAGLRRRYLPVYISFRNKMVQSKVKVRSQSHVTTYGQSISMSLCLVRSALKGFHPNEFQSDIRRRTLRRNFLCCHCEGCMWSIQCNVEFGYQLSICSGTKENHGKPWSSWPLAGPSGCKLTSSQQFGIEYASPNIIPYLCWFTFLSFFFWKRLQVPFTKILSVYHLDKYQTVYNTCGRNECI
jgi:hypothetical protein